ncbi:HNH endonuclease [Caldibacillus thermoamylovorans]
MEVHHLIPLSEIGEQYTVNPFDDLRPVCPNCHAMLHRGNLSIEELREIVEARSLDREPKQRTLMQEEKEKHFSQKPTARSVKR